jgi:glycerol uptake facilitator-like aquaporin
MSTGAWIFMTLSWGFVIVLNFFCFGRILKNHK